MSNVIGFISCFVMFIIEHINLSLISHKKIDINIKKIFLIFIVSTINFMCVFFEPIFIKMIVSFISVYYISKYIIRNSSEESISLAIVYYILLVISELIISVIMVNLIRIDAIKYILSKGYVKSLMSIITSLLLLLFSVCKITNKIFVMITRIVKKIKIKSTAISLFIILICIIQFIYVYNISTLNTFVMILYILMFLGVLVYFSFSIYRNYYLKSLNEILKNNDEKMNQLLNEYKMYKHNTRHQLMAIASAGNKKVKKMVDSYLNEFLISSDYICNASSMPVGLRGVIYEKLVSFNNCNIQVDNFIKNDPLDMLSVKTYCKLVQSLSIMLDNSLEYCKNNVENNYVYLLLNEEKNKYTIQCCNNFTNDINITDNSALSDKKKNMGVGQNYILNRTGFNFKISINNNVYKTSITIKK